MQNKPQISPKYSIILKQKGIWKTPVLYTRQLCGEQCMIWIPSAVRLRLDSNVAVSIPVKYNKKIQKTNLEKLVFILFPSCHHSQGMGEVAESHTVCVGAREWVRKQSECFLQAFWRGCSSMLHPSRPRSKPACPVPRFTLFSVVFLVYLQISEKTKTTSDGVKVLALKSNYDVVFIYLYIFGRSW